MAVRGAGSFPPRSPVFRLSGDGAPASSFTEPRRARAALVPVCCHSQADGRHSRPRSHSTPTHSTNAATTSAPTAPVKLSAAAETSMSGPPILSAFVALEAIAPAAQQNTSGSAMISATGSRF